MREPLREEVERRMLERAHWSNAVRDLRLDVPSAVAVAVEMIEQERKATFGEHTLAQEWQGRAEAAEKAADENAAEIMRLQGELAERGPIVSASEPLTSMGPDEVEGRRDPAPVQLRHGWREAMIGWECPKCGRCYSPFTAACGYCGPVTVSGTATNSCTCGKNITTACPIHGVR